MYTTRNVRPCTISCCVKLSYKHPRFSVREENVAKIGDGGGGGGGGYASGKEPCLLVYHERRQRTHNHCKPRGCCVSLQTIEYCGRKCLYKGFSKPCWQGHKDILSRYELLNRGQLFLLLILIPMPPCNFADPHSQVTL